MAISATRVELGGTELTANRHVCAFYHSADEQYDLLMPFIVAGMEAGQKGYHIVDGRLRMDHFRRLSDAALDPEGLSASGQLEVKLWEDAYLRDGHFDQNAMLQLIEEVLDSGPKQGYELTRLVAQMEWALEDRPGVDDLVEYETRLNYLLPRYKDPVI